MFDFTKEQGNVSILVLDGFSTLSLGSLLEPLHFFSKSFPKTAPNIELVSTCGRNAVSISGVHVGCNLQLTTYLERLPTTKGKHVLVICGPTDMVFLDEEILLSALRKLRRHRVVVYGIGSVCLLMAQAGMFEGDKCAVHWKTLATFTESNFSAEGVNSLFVRNSTVGSCAGETAVLDLAVDLIGDVSKEASFAAASHFLIKTPRFGNEPQPGSQTYRIRGAPKQLADAVEIMAENIEETLSLRVIATRCQISSRQMERMFRRHLNVSPGTHYRSLRLERAYELLANTNLDLREVALASGFSTTSCLSKHFKTRYGETPAQRRKRGIQDILSW